MAERNLKFTYPLHHGSDVLWVQQRLRIHSHDPGPLDGIFGGKTDRATRTFQAAFGLDIDGVVGPLTRAALASIPQTESAKDGSLVDEFLAWLRAQVGHIYVWGAQGQVVPGEGWISQKETSGKNAARAVALYRRRKAEGLDPVLAYDCSGLIMCWLMAHDVYGYDMSAASLYKKCVVLARGDLRPGDLVFHHNGVRIHHVGVYMGNGQVVEEESRSISENVTWGQRKRFADGKVSLPYKSFLGYERGPDGIPRIVETEAALVRRIYGLFMSGKTACAIAKALTDEGVPTPTGKAKWSASTIESILTNEKYRGSAKLQKRFTVDFLTKTMKVNEGEVPQYYVEYSHAPIVQPDEWDAVQQEFARRKALGRSYSGNSVFASRIVCGDCGGFYGAKVWNSTNKYRRTIWQCNAKFKGAHKCTTPHLDEEDVKARFLAAFSTLFDGRNALIANCEQVKAMYADHTAIDAELAERLREIEVIVELTRKCIEENASRAQDQDEYRARYNAYAERYDAAKAKVEALEQERSRRLARADAFDGFIRAVKGMDAVPSEFGDKLWQKTIDTATVRPDGKIVFKFQNGIEIEK